MFKSPEETEKKSANKSIFGCVIQYLPSETSQLSLKVIGIFF